MLHKNSEVNKLLYQNGVKPIYVFKEAPTIAKV